MPFLVQAGHVQLVHGHDLPTAEAFGELVGRIAALHREQAPAAVGAARPGVFLSSYNVGSLTREEARSSYVAERAAAGEVVDPATINLETRNDAEFERYWQDQMQLRDYGQDHPRVLLELHARTGALGMEAASAYGVDMIHAGRLTGTDANGQPQDFIGQEMLDMMAESLIDTRPLRLSLRNRAVEDVATYAWENDDKLVTFVTWHNMPPGALQVKVAGLSTGAYKAVWAETLHAEVPADWMTRFGIPDNPDVDETPESQSFALGVREHIPVTQLDDAVQVTMDRPHEILRLVFAKTDAGMAEIAGWEDQDPLLLQPPADDGTGLPPVDMGTPPAEEDPDTPDPSAMDDGGAGAELGGMLGALLLVAVLAMAL